MNYSKEEIRKIVETNYKTLYNLDSSVWDIMPDVAIKNNGTISVSFYREVDMEYLFFSINRTLYVLEMEKKTDGHSLRDLIYNASGKTFIDFDSEYITYVPKGKRGQCEVNIEKYATKLTSLEDAILQKEEPKPIMANTKETSLHIGDEMKKLYDKLIALHIAKQKEYCNGERWDSAFVQQAAFRGQSRQQKVADGLGKHLSSIFTAVDGKPLSFEQMSEKIGDAIIYLAMLHEMYREEADKLP